MKPACHQIQALLRVLTSDYVIYNARQFQSIATYRLSITVNEANVYTPLAAQYNIFVNLANRVDTRVDDSLINLAPATTSYDFSPH